MAKVIVHISGDYPDAVQPRKTRAVSSLVEAVHDTFDQHVYSINRTSPSGRELLSGLMRNPVKPGFKVRLTEADNGVTAVEYDGLPAGLFMQGTLSQLADRIADDLVRRGIRPDLLHGHKLTLEGLIAERVSLRFKCPFALSLQVNTDRKILKFRPDLTPAYRRIYHGAAVVFPFSVMGQRVCDAVLGPRDKPTCLLPCSSSQDRILAPKVTAPVLSSVFHLKDQKNKNVAALVTASKALQDRHRDYAFHLYGGGSLQDESRIDQLAAQAEATSFVRKGPIAHENVQDMLNGMCGFAMVSKRETFGMVFLEAILAGCPVVYPKDWAIDGFFDGASFALAAPSDDVPAIEAAMEKLITDQERLKGDLAEWQQTGQLARFQRSNVIAAYETAVRKVLSGEQST